MRQFFATAAFAGILLASAVVRPLPARAEGPQVPLPTGPNAEADELLCATIERLVEALGQVLQDVPRFAPPEMDKNGNIILRRLNPPLTPPSVRPPARTLDEASA